MKRLIVIAVFGLLAVVSLHAQCVATAEDPCVLTHQSTLDKTGALVDKYKDALATIEAFKVERLANAKLKADYEDLVSKMQKVTTIDTFIQAREAEYHTLTDAIIKFQADLLEKMQKQLGSKRSRFDKVLNALKAAYYVIAVAVLVA